MQDRLDFLRAIEYKNISLENAIKRYFDELMCLYDITGLYDNFTIIGEFENRSIIFKIVFKNENDAIIMYNNIQGYVFYKYGVKYTISSKQHNNVLYIDIQVKCS